MPSKERLEGNLQQILNQQIKEKMHKRELEQIKRVNEPHIMGNMGYPQIKEFSLQEIKSKSFSLYKTHQQFWSKQIQERQSKLMNNKKEEMRIKAKLDSDNNLFLQQLQEKRRQKLKVRI